MSCHSVSYFNTQDVCCDCKTEERQFPNYQKALDAETAQVQAGNLAYQGIGLAEEDRVMMRQLIAVRKGSDDAQAHRR